MGKPDVVLLASSFNNKLNKLVFRSRDLEEAVDALVGSSTT